MSQLSAQSIRRLCVDYAQNPVAARGPAGNKLPMISDFVDEKIVVNGKSYGLSACSYDVRIAQDVTLGPNPAYLARELLLGLQPAKEIIAQMRAAKPAHALASTIENFAIPLDVVGYVVDKSTYARVFVSAFNTLFDPGFVGNATLELVNHSDKEVTIKAGDPICQFTFQWLDQTTDRPYAGKYQHQAQGPQPARFE